MVHKGWALNPEPQHTRAYNNTKTKRTLALCCFWWPDSPVDGSRHCVGVCVLEIVHKKNQQKWKWLGVSAGELSHQRESQTHSSPARRETALTQQNLNNVLVWKKKKMHVCILHSSSWNDFLDRVTSICQQQMLSLFLFHVLWMEACNPVGMSSVTRRLTRANVWFFFCLWEGGRGHASDTEKTSNRSCDPPPASWQPNFVLCRKTHKSFHLDRGWGRWSPVDNIPVSFMSAWRCMCVSYSFAFR